MVANVIDSITMLRFSKIKVDKAVHACLPELKIVPNLF